MPLFHKHNFKPTNLDHRFVCSCGKAKCLHFWKKIKEMSYTKTYTNGGKIDERSAVLQCIYCGEIKSQKL